MLGGNVNSLAGVVHNSSYSSSTLQIKKPEATQFNNIGKDKVSNESSGLSEEDEILICENEEDEDEDSNDLSREKCRSVIGFHSIASYQSFLSLSHSAKALPFFWPKVSYRYILQRNLRIWFSISA